MINWLNEPKDEPEECMGPTTKKELKDKIAEIRRHLSASGRPGTRQKLGELEGLVDHLPEPYKKSKNEYVSIVESNGIKIRVFYDYTPEEPSTLVCPRVDEDVAVNHAEFICLLDLEEAVLDHIDTVRHDESAAEMKTDDGSFYNKKIGR